MKEKTHNSGLRLKILPNQDVKRIEAILKIESRALPGNWLV